MRPIPDTLARLRPPAWLLAAFVGAALLWIMLPRHGVLFEYDEGYNGMKTLLHMRGFEFYRDIWSDQPPLLYFLLGAWFEWVGVGLREGRIFVLACSALLLGAFTALVRIEHGKATAILAAVFLFTSWKYIQLSVSLMETIPALTFAVLSLLCASAYVRRSRVAWLAGAAAFAAMAVYCRIAMCGLFVLLPLRWRLAQNRSAPPWRRSAAVFFACSAAALLLGAFLLRPLDWRQILQPHAASTFTNAFFPENAGWRMVPRFLLRDYHLSLLAIAGIATALGSRSDRDLFAVWWLALTAAALALFKPVWWHYHALLAIPLSWVAARGLVAFLSRHYREPEDHLFSPRRTARPLLLTVAILLFGFAAPSRLLQTFDFLREPGFDINSFILESLTPFADRTQWVLTDDRYQAYPFEIGLLCPPALAVTSPKRIAFGELAPEDWAAALDEYNPEQVLFSIHFPFPDAMTAAIEERYYIVRPSPTVLHGIRKDLAEPARIERLQKRHEILAHFAAIMRSEPGNPLLRWQVGIELGKLGEAADSIRFLEEAIRINPSFIEARNSVAWILATHPDAAFRRPDDAIRHAEAACAITQHRHPILLDTLGAAYAAAGRFDEAIETARRARTIAERTGASGIVERIDDHIRTYEAGRPLEEKAFIPNDNPDNES